LAEIWDDLGVVIAGRAALDTGSPSYKGFRYPAQIIAHCVWLYHRFPLSFREVEELMLARGVIVSYETIRPWCARFGPAYAAGPRKEQPGHAQPGDHGAQQPGRHIGVVDGRDAAEHRHHRDEHQHRDSPPLPQRGRRTGHHRLHATRGGTPEMR
jgi:hypothetical protein